MDEQLKAAEEEFQATQAEEDSAQDTGEQTPSQESPTEEETAEDTEDVEEESTDESDGDTEETVRSSGKGYQSRVKQLVRERNEARQQAEEAKSLAQRFGKISGQGEANPQPPQYTQQADNDPIVRQGEEITAEELDRRIRERESRLLQTAEARSELKMRQNEAVSRINDEVRQVTTEYGQLNPESDNFDAELSDAITEAVEAQVRQSPYSSSVKKIVDRLMKPYQKGVSKELGKARENMAKQVSQAALRPSNVRNKEKDTSEKTIEELEADLGTVIA